MNIGENIFKLRSERGMSQGALAEALEVSRQSISKWENGGAVPELDKLVRMSKLFSVTLDELVFGKPPALPTATVSTPQIFPRFTLRTTLGGFLLLFGMIFFLLSVFWGNHLALGEEFGELLSISIVLVSIALLATFNKAVLSACAVIYFVYAIICTGILHVVDMKNYIFLFFTGIVILVWFILQGLLTSKAEK